MSGMKWRPCLGLPTYEVSEYGDVRRTVWSKTRKAGHIPSGHVCNGYRRYKLVTPAGKRVLLAHRLVLEAFVGPASTSKHQCAHGDGDRQNNHISNLRWATPKENIGEDRRRHGRGPTGERNPHAKLTADKVRELRREYLGLPKRLGAVTALRERYGIGKSGFESIIRRKTWAHVWP